MDVSRAEIAPNDKADDEILRRMLEAVEQNAAVTQRSLAGDLGIALGLANSYLRRCIRKGFIKIRQVPRRRYAYYLTPQGFAEKSRLTASYFTSSFAFYREARGQCEALLTMAAARGQNRIVLLGEGDLADILRLVARETPVQIVATVPVADFPELAANRAGAKAIDAFVVTALMAPADAHAAAAATVGADRILVPDMLRNHIRWPAPEGGDA